MPKQEIRSFLDLDVWNVAMDLTVASYSVSAKLPLTERFELSAPIRRAATSVPANIAEGHATGRDGMFIRHLCIALGSLGELHTHLLVGLRVQFLTAKDVSPLSEQINRTGQLLHGLLRALRRRRLKKIASPLLLLVGPAF